MPSSLHRGRFAGAVAVAFFSGLVFASAGDFTRFGWAQGKTQPSPQAVKPLADIGSAFEAIAEHVTPAVVSIETERQARGRMRTLPNDRNHPPGLEDLFRQFEPQQNVPQESSGSGFIVSKDGYILTNNHVVADADKVTVGLLDKRRFPAKVVGRDPTTDVAVLKIDASDLPVAVLGDDSKTRVGQWVVAIGNPLQLDFTVTAGIISSKGRSLSGLYRRNDAIQDFIQTDAAINPGNSGGPLVNIRGEVIGINSAIASQTGFYAGYGFAIPITLAKRVMQDLIAFGRVKRAVLGVGINDVTPEQARAAGLKQIEGAIVGSFLPSDDSPAKRAGIELGDVIVAVDGQPTDRVSTLQRVIRDHKPGETVTVEVMRFGERKTFRVKLQEAQPEPDTDEVASGSRGAAPGAAGAAGAARSYDKLGITVGAVPAELLRQVEVPAAYRNGLLVTDVDPAGPGYRLFDPDRDIIVRVLSPRPQREIRSAADLEGVLSTLKNGDVVTFLVFNVAGGGQTRVVTVPIGER
ncbi:MAG: Do family serine endopeptidase [Gemmatimonadaceae bacterium]